MLQIPPHFRIRQIERFRIARSEHGFAIVESKVRWWIAYLAVVLFTIVLTWIMIEYYGNIDDIAWYVIGATAIPLLLIGFCFIAFHQRIVIDRRDKVIRDQRRFAFIPIRSRKLPLRGSRIVAGPMPLRYTHDKNEGQVDGVGCLLIFLGPVGTAVGAARTLGNKESRVRQAPGVYLVDADGNPTPLFAMKPGHVLRVVDLYEADPDLVLPRYHDTPELADRYLAQRDSGRSRPSSS